jgi:ornithine cyclodeaminase/alanine dehydrogenase-like protein (mu-crystallin family)
VRILSRREVLELLSLRECIAAVESAFRLHADGRTLGPGVLGCPPRGAASMSRRPDS